MTRAIDRLIVSGSIDPERKADERTPIGWVLGRLDCAEELAAAGEAPLELEREGARVLVRVDRTLPPAEEPVPELVPAVVDEATGQLALFAAGEEPKLPPLAPALAPIQALPEPPLHDVRRLSYSALALFERCSYRYYAERVAGMRRGARARDRRGADGPRRDRGRRRGAPAAGARRPVGAGGARRRAGASVVSGRDGRGAGADRRVRRQLLRLGAGAADRGARRRPARAAVRVRARRRAPARPARRPPRRRGRGRSCSTTRRTRSPRGRPRRSSRPTTACSGSSTRSRASAPAWTRSRSSTTSSSGRTPSSRRRSRAPTCPSSRPSSRRRSAASARGEFVPTPSEFNCAGCPALDVVCAGPRLRGGPSRPPALAAAG